MLRLPPSLITISAVELQDFCLRQKARLHVAQPNRSSQADIRLSQPARGKNPSQYELVQVASENRVAGNEARREPTSLHQGNRSTDRFSNAIDSSYDIYHFPDESVPEVDLHMQDEFEDLGLNRYEDPTHSRTESQRSAARTGSNREDRDAAGHMVDGRRCSSDDGQYSTSDSNVGQENEPEFLPVSQDSTQDIRDHAGEREQKSYRISTSPSKHRFDYGGFIETLSLESSSFMPDDHSTPAPPVKNDVQRLRPRLPLPRSSLHISELAASSPERKDADGSVPTASSSTSSTASTGLLAQPPRRTPKTYRPRTISYSYEESERASAVYEDPQVNVSDNDNSQIDIRQRREQVSLHEELRGSSLHSVSERADSPSSPPGPMIIHNHEANRTMYFSSPHLPGELPPPFSTVNRRTSFAASIPSIASQEGYKSDESAEIVEDSPSPSPSPRRKHNTEERKSQANLRSTGPMQMFSRIFSGRRKERSPISSPEPAGTTSPPTTPRQSIENASISSQSSTVTPRQSLRIYDDSLPSTSQPQTPAHLPESRHQSRLHPSYTAPVTRQGRRAFVRLPRLNARVTNSATRNRIISGRSDSPLGMGGERGEGFRGLYGGQENIDDDVLFDNAARRLWDTGRARSAERRGSDGTPERELSIAEIRRQYQ